MCAPKLGAIFALSSSYRRLETCQRDSAWLQNGYEQKFDADHISPQELTTQGESDDVQRCGSVGFEEEV